MPKKAIETVGFSSEFELLQHEVNRCITPAQVSHTFNSILNGANRYLTSPGHLPGKAIVAYQKGTIVASSEYVAAPKLTFRKIHRQYTDLQFKYLRLTLSDIKRVIAELATDKTGKWVQVLHQLFSAIEPRINALNPPLHRLQHLEYYQSLFQQLVSHLASEAGRGDLQRVAKYLPWDGQRANLLSLLWRQSCVTNAKRDQFQVLFPALVSQQDRRALDRFFGSQGGNIREHMMIYTLHARDWTFVDWLLEARVDVNKRSGVYSESSALIYALWCGLGHERVTSIVKNMSDESLLFQHKAEAMSALMLMSRKPEYLPVVQLMVAKLAVRERLSDVDNTGLNALHHAIDCHNVAAARALLNAPELAAESKRLLVNRCNGKGVSPLWMACYEAKKINMLSIAEDPMVKLMLEHGADRCEFSLNGVSFDEFCQQSRQVALASGDDVVQAMPARIPLVQAIPVEQGSVGGSSASERGLVTGRSSPAMFNLADNTENDLAAKALDIPPPAYDPRL